MKRVYYFILTLLSVAVLSWVLPWILDLCFPYSPSDPFVGYSPVNDRFIMNVPTENTGEEGTRFTIREIDPATGESGRTYTEDQRDSLLPEIFANQLASKNLMPDSIKGVEMSMPNIRRNRWLFSSLPRNINRDIPEVYPLMESMPKRFDLEAPQVVLYMPGHVEIIDIKTNSLDSLKTRRFAKMFADRGFQFPAIEASANVTTRKAYDNGYLLIDANHDLYHLKMQVGRPSMARIPRPDSITPAHVFVMENADRAQYGLVTTVEGPVYAIARDENYSLVELPGVTFDPEKQRMSILKGLFAWTIKISDDKSIKWVALSADGSELLTTHSYTYPENKLEKITSWIFPFLTTFTSGNDYLVYPRISRLSWHALFLNLILCAILFAIMRRRRQCNMITDIILTIVFGIYAFIPLILIKK